MITRQQAALLAQLARTYRPEWDELTTINTILQIPDQPLHRIATHVVLTANNPQSRTPKALLLPPNTITHNPTGTPRQHETCTKPGHSGWATNCPQCRSETIATTTN